MKKLLILLLAGLYFTACTSTDDDSGMPEDQEPPVANCDVIEVSGTINEPTVWEEGFVYVIGSDLSVRSVLTIKPGTIIKIRNASISIYEEGKILAEGTADKRIVFTSLADDRYCGDTNGDGNATQAEKGDWVDLDLHGTIGSVFKYVDIFYAGQPSGGNSQAVVIDWAQSAAFTFDNCRIAHTYYNSGSSSHAFHGSTHMKDANVSKFTNNALYDNGKPIYFNSFYTLNPNNKFHDPENPSVKNSHNGIYLYGHVLDATTQWHNTEVPYVVDQFHQVYNSATINIGPNVVVKFMSTSAGLQRSHPQNIILHDTAILTSYKDDAHGGDTNGDGTASSPTNGDWEGFYNNYSGSPYWQQGPNILYAAN